MSGMGEGIARALIPVSNYMEQAPQRELQQMQADNLRMNLNRAREQEAERQQTKQDARTAYQRSLTPVTTQYDGGDGQALNDPEFGLDAAYGKEGPGLRRNLKNDTGDTRVDTGKYQDEFLNLVAQHQPDKMQQVMAARKQLQDEGIQDAVKKLMMGNVAEAEKSWNSTGQDRIDPGSLKYDAKTGAVSYRQNGQENTVQLSQLAALAGIKLDDGGEWRVADGVQYNTKTGETRQLPGGAGSGTANAKKMNELISMGVPAEVARGIAYGTMKTVTDPNTGATNIIDLSNSKLVGSMQAKDPNQPFAGFEWKPSNYYANQSGPDAGSLPPAKAWEAYYKAAIQANPNADIQQIRERFKAKYGIDAPGSDMAGGGDGEALASDNIDEAVGGYKQVLEKRAKNQAEQEAKGKANETAARVLQYARGQKYNTNYTNDQQVVKDIRDIWKYMTPAQRDRMMPIYLQLGGDQSAIK